MDQWRVKLARFRLRYDTRIARMRLRAAANFPHTRSEERVRVGYTTAWQAASRCESPQAAPGLSLPTGGASSGSHTGRV
jgi:hypothetical protein